MGIRRKFSRFWQRRYFAYPFQVANDAMRMNVHKTLYPLYPISLFWLNFNSQFLSGIFSTLWLSEMFFLFINFLISIFSSTFSFHKLPYIHFFEHFLLISHNLRIINGHSNITAEKTKKFGTLAKVFQAMRSGTVLTTLSDNLLKL